MRTKTTAELANMASQKERNWHGFWITSISSVLISVSIGCNRSDNKSQLSSSEIAPEITTQPSAGPKFEDFTKASGVHSVYENGESAGVRSIVESLGGGLGVTDYDADGLDDLLFPGGGTFVPDKPLPGMPNALWRNLDGEQFVDVSEQAETRQSRHYTHGCAIADYDADGFADLLLTGYGGLQLFRNHGDGTFEEVAIKSGLTDEQWSTSAAWADLDHDGNLDVYVTHYVDWSWENNPDCSTAAGGKRDICSPQDFNPLLDLIYFNEGDGKFRAGREDVGISIAGKGLGVIAFDANGDSFTDIYVANDTTNNFLFVNDGAGQFKEKGVISGTALDQRGVSNGSMGVAVLDYNNDLQPDLWVTNYENETFSLYHNDQAGMFRCLTESTGVTALGTLYVGFGTVAADFLRTGFEDIIVSNGHVMLHPANSTVAQYALYLHNNGRSKISQAKFTSNGYFSSQHRGRGVIYADFDRDGKLDVGFSHTNEPASLLRQTTDLNGRWFAIKLVGTQSNRDAIGATVTLEAGKRKMMRTVVGGGSYLSQNTYQVWFGVPEATITSGTLTVQWPNSNSKQQVTIEANQYHTIVEGS